MTRAPGGWSRVGGSVPHFLDSLACLFFGGAHFKHIVSTESETRETQSHPTLANQLRGKTRHENPGDLRAWRHVCNKVRRFLEHCAGTCDWWFLVLGALQVLLHQFGRHTDDVLTFPVLHHVERLQRADDVTLCDAGHLAGRRRRTRRLKSETAASSFFNSRFCF